MEVYLAFTQEHKVMLKNAHTKCERLLGRDGKAHVNNKRGEEKRLNLKILLWEINETGITSFLCNFNPVTFFFLNFERPLLKFGQLFVTCTTALDVDETTKSNFQKLSTVDLSVLFTWWKETGV